MTKSCCTAKLLCPSGALTGWREAGGRTGRRQGGRKGREGDGEREGDREAECKAEREGECKAEREGDGEGERDGQRRGEWDGERGRERDAAGGDSKGERVRGGARLDRIIHGLQPDERTNCCMTTDEPNFDCRYGAPPVPSTDSRNLRCVPVSSQSPSARIRTAAAVPTSTPLTVRVGTAQRHAATQLEECAALRGSDAA